MAHLHSGYTYPHVLYVVQYSVCCLAIAVPPALQIGSHTAVPVYSIVAVVDFFYLFLDFLFLGIIIRLPVFPVVIVGIRADPQPPQQPADAEFFMVLFDKPISL